MIPKSGPLNQPYLIQLNNMVAMCFRKFISENFKWECTCSYAWHMVRVHTKVCGYHIGTCSDIVLPT